METNINLDLFPESRDFKAKGLYYLKNKTDKNIDSIIINYNCYENNFSFVKTVKLISKDTVFNFNIYKLKTPLIAGDSIKFSFEVYNKKNTLVTNNWAVIENGTFVNNSNLFPSIGYNDQMELTDDKVRKEYGLKPKDQMAKTTNERAKKTNIFQTMLIGCVLKQQ